VVTRDPFAALPTSARLWVAAALSFATLGLQWTVSAGYLSPGYIYFGDCGYSTGEYCTPDQFVMGSYTPGHVVIATHASVRIFLVFAAAVFALCATGHRTETTRRLARVAILALVAALALAVSARATIALMFLVLAVALTLPLVLASGTRAR
jgi:hypothetical protein